MWSYIPSLQAQCNASTDGTPVILAGGCLLCSFLPDQDGLQLAHSKILLYLSLHFGSTHEFHSVASQRSLAQ